MHLTCALARARILLLLPILFTTTCAWSFHPPGAWSSRLHALRRVAHGHGSNGVGFSLRPAASPRPAASATGRQPANMNAGTGAGTALVAAENRQHNGFMHVEGPDRVSVMWKEFEDLGILTDCNVLDARAATEAELRSVHTEEHVAAVLGGDAVRDASTYFHKKNNVSSTAALLAAGGTLQV